MNTACIIVAILAAAANTRRPRAWLDHSADSGHHRSGGEQRHTGKVTLRYQGHLYQIGISRTHARTHITLLVADLDIRIIATATGELLRHLTLDPTPPLPAHRQTTRTTTPKTTTTRPLTWVRAVRDVLRHHPGGPDGAAFKSAVPFPPSL